jgi:hypothetical protein
MTPEQSARSVSIAHDVLAHLKVLQMHTGAFLYPRGDDIFGAHMPGEDLGAHLDDARKTCYVCALGACFLSALGVTGGVYRLSAREARCGVEYNEIEPTLLASLGARNVALIEAAFERGTGWYGGWEVDVDLAAAGVPRGDYDDAVAFGERYTDHKERTRAIMQNMIDNMGEFTPGEVAVA